MGRGRRVAIVGVGRTAHRSKRPDVNWAEMFWEAASEAVNDANLKFKDIDTVISGNMELFEGLHRNDMWLSDYIGGYLNSGFRASSGGTTGATVGVTAMELVASGLSDICLGIAGEKQSEGDSRLGLTYGAGPMRGTNTAPGGAIFMAARAAGAYMQRTGCREEHAAMLRLRVDRNACQNPKAHLKLGLKSIEEVLASKYLITPLRLLDMCPTSEGAYAVIVASEEKARKITNKPVWVVDWEVVHTQRFTFGFSGETHGIAGEAIFKRNGITKPRQELSVVEIYDPSTYLQLYLIESIHLCEEGEAWKLEEKGAWDLNSECPVNPSGGVIATNAIGGTALARICEVALELREDCGGYQIARKPHLGLSTGLGHVGWTVFCLMSNTLD